MACDASAARPLSPRLSTARRSCCSARTTPTCACTAASRTPRARSRTASTRRSSDGDAAAIRRDAGTKLGLHYALRLEPGATAPDPPAPVGRVRGSRPVDADGAVVRRRVAEADAFYEGLQDGITDPDARAIFRQAAAGLIWSKQLYGYDVRRWLEGDPLQPAPPREREGGRNSQWRHLAAADVLSMPDTWEYPWFAAWDLAFHCLPLALLDPDFAKKQLLLLTREWYMHPNGQLPAYEWEFGDANPPVHAWATYRVFEIDRERRGGRGDLAFLEGVFHKLLINFTWWVNRKDAQGRNVFQGGFLGLDNVGVFDRSRPPPGFGVVHQADGTAWMAMYALNMMRIALELALHNDVYESTASKFFEHFLLIAEAMTDMGGEAAAKASACGTRSTSSTTTRSTSPAASGCPYGSAPWSGWCRSSPWR